MYRTAAVLYTNNIPIVANHPVFTGTVPIFDLHSLLISDVNYVSQAYLIKLLLHAEVVYIGDHL